MSAVQLQGAPFTTVETAPTRPIKSIGTPGGEGGGVVGGASEAKGPGFGDVLVEALGRAGEAERSAGDQAARFAAGDPSVGIHEAVIAAEKANISVRYAVTLKNKALEAYRELMNTPV